jgi:hypothetical protein
MGPGKLDARGALSGLARDASARAMALALAGAALVGCATDSTPDPSGTPTPSGGGPVLPRGDDVVELDPADFTLEITNRYWPMSVGDRWVYQEYDGEGGTQRVEVTVLDETKVVAIGIEARVVHDLVTANGEVVEDTYDYYAQDTLGNLWYLGEETKEYQDGEVVSTEGSWEAGVDGAQPGVLVPAAPVPGMAYRQEYLAGEAEDEAVVLSVHEQAQTPTGTYSDVLLTRDTTPLTPDIAELKFYAPGIGPVLVLQTAGGTSREALTETNRPGVQQ